MDSPIAPVPPDWLLPDWPAPLGVRAVCTTRNGGASGAPYASLNLGSHVGDAATQVAQNRALLANAIGARPVFLNQVHGTGVLQLNADTPDALDADACMTVHSGLACTIMVADCLPLLLTTRDGRCVAAAHAGWRGLSGGVFAAIFKRFIALAGVDSHNIAIKIEAIEVLAWLGPCIGPEAFEVGPEVREAFVAQQPLAARHFRPHGAGKFLADLPALARLSLQTLGVQQIYGNDGSPPWCTVGNPSRFFSHRRDGVSGRFAACIWRV